jgi:hypothetical protein
VEVWDDDKAGSSNLKDHELQGVATFTMAELMTSGTATLRKVIEAIAAWQHTACLCARSIQVSDPPKVFSLLLLSGTHSKTLYKGKSAPTAGEKVSVRVPPSGKPGDVIEARTKAGEVLRLTVPPGTKAGDVLVVKAPPTPGGKAVGTVTISGEELQACSEFLFLGLCGKHLANKDGFFGKSDPYYEVHKAREDGTWVPVYRSIFLKNTLNPSWPVAKKISVQSLCNGDYDRPLRIEVRGGIGGDG